MPSIIPPTKGEVRWRAFAYVAVFLVGVFVMFDKTYDPDGVKLALGFWSALVWSGFMGTALVASIATWAGRWRVEYVVMPLFGIALAVAVLFSFGVLVYQGLEGVPVDWQRAARATSAASLLFLLAARYTNLRRLVRAVKAHEPWITRQ